MSDPAGSMRPAPSPDCSIMHGLPEHGAGASHVVGGDHDLSARERGVGEVDVDVSLGKQLDVLARSPKRSHLYRSPARGRPRASAGRGRTHHWPGLRIAGSGRAAVHAERALRRRYRTAVAATAAQDMAIPTATTAPAIGLIHSELASSRAVPPRHGELVTYRERTAAIRLQEPPFSRHRM